VVYVVSVTQYSSHPSPEINFNAYRIIDSEAKKNAVIQVRDGVKSTWNLDKQAVSRIRYMGDRMPGTMTGTAIQFMHTHGFTEQSGARVDDENVLKVAIVITDGMHAL
jgi:hypothetical protein